MPHSLRVALVGNLVEISRATMRFSQRKLAARAKELQLAYPGNYLKAATLDNTLICRIENSVTGEGASMQHRKTAQLLADALGVEVEFLLAEQTTVLVDKIQPLVDKPKQFPLANDERGAIFEPASLILHDFPVSQFAEVRLLDFNDPAYFVLLPFTSVAARARFVEMRGWEAVDVNEEKIRYYFPSRPIEQYMKDNSRVFEVDGDSMEPEIRSGVRIVADEIPKDEWGFLVNTIVVISYANVLTVRHIVGNDLILRGTLTLHPRSGLSEFTVRERDINCIFEVHASFERKIYKK